MALQIVVPFGTLRGDAFDDDDKYTDDEFKEAPFIATGRFPVSDAEEASKLIAAAEVFGFHCSYVSNPPDDEDRYSVVTIKVRMVDTSP